METNTSLEPLLFSKPQGTALGISVPRSNISSSTQASKLSSDVGRWDSFLFSLLL